MFNPKTFTTGRPMNLRITYPKHKVMDYLVREDFRKMPSKSAPFNVMQYCELKDGRGVLTYNETSGTLDLTLITMAELKDIVSNNKELPINDPYVLETKPGMAIDDVVLYVIETRLPENN